MSYISAYYDYKPISDHIKCGYFNEMNCGGASIWTIGPKPQPEDMKHMLWMTEFLGFRYVFVFYRYAEVKLEDTEFFRLIDKELIDVGADTHVFHMDELLPEFDLENEMWKNLDGDDLCGTLTLIDTDRLNFESKT